MSKNALGEKPKVPAKILVTNISQRHGGAGLFLDPGEAFGNRILGPGRSMTFDCPGGVLPDLLQIWGKNVAIYDASSGIEVLSPSNGELSPGLVAPVREMAAAIDGDPKRDDFLDDELPGLDEMKNAQDAVMPGLVAGQSPRELRGPIAGDLRQQAPRAKVSLGTRNDEIVGGELSPIPGDRPRDLDNSAQYTIKAPRAQHVGGVIGKK